MGIRQRKDKGTASQKGELKGLQQKSSADESPASEGRMPEEAPVSKFARGKKNDPKGRSAFMRATSLDTSEEEDSVMWSGATGQSVSTAVDQERIQKEKERKRAKREQERARGHRQQESSNRTKRGPKAAAGRSFLQTFTGSEFRSRIGSLFIYLLVAGAIVGIFVLKALEEYYSLDGDISGEDRLKHLGVLGLEDGATESDIRRSYRTLSIRWHPDRNTNCGPSCQQRFQEVAAAYEYLMRKERKSKVDEDGESGDATDSEDASGLKVTSQGIIDFSSLGPKDVFPPTTDTKNIWSIMVHQDKDEWSQSVYEMWQESSRSLGKYVKFGVITIRGRSGKEALKKLPINVKIYPAILLLTAGMHPEQYPNLSRPSVESINRFIADSFPSNIDIVNSVASLRTWLSSSSPSLHPQAAQYKVVIIPSAASSTSPSLLVKHTAFSNKQTFSFCFLANARSILANQREELLSTLKNPPTWLKQLPTNSTVAKALKLPVQQEELREEELLANSSMILFADEGRGVSRAQASLHTLRSKLLNPATALVLAIDRFKEAIQPLLYQQNSASLCKGSLQRRVFCLVAIEPAEDHSEPRRATSMKTLDLARIKSLLQESKHMYLKENPRKDLETIWERAIGKAKEYERTGEEAAEFDGSTREPDDLHIEQPDDVEEEIIQVQLVRVSIGTPTAVPSLPALPRDTMFTRLVREELDEAAIFLLDLEGSRVAAVPPLYVKSEGSGSKSAESFYRRLYQALDELQSLSDEEESRIVFSALPDYCSGQEFPKRCLASSQPSWLWQLLTGWSLIQVSVFAALGGAAFMFWNKMSSEMFLVGILLLSLGIGALSTIQPLLSSLLGGQ